MNVRAHTPMPPTDEDHGLRIDASRPAAAAALDKAAVPHEIYVAENADHAFFNDTGQRYNPAAATEAWRRVTDCYARYLG
ncbi:dienelactone hydrolase family protein [Nocardia sp. 2]|uniref:Dienelactone hydrolase family protein n=1 Tax=Nocardia acididurans TaxID=2802282 RepID=A0ABS1M182_9NOCA|nr:dienelactone hydrolase family protein [Nocardia acididurans]